MSIINICNKGVFNKKRWNMKIIYSALSTSLYFLFVFSLVSCSSSSTGNGGGGNGGGGNGSVTTSGINVIMSSSQLASANISEMALVGKAQTQTDCQIALSSEVQESGKCITPLNVGGNVSSISLSSQYNMGDAGPARILGGGSELALTSAGAVDVESFTLTEADQISAGEDTVSSTTYYFDRIQLLLANIDVKFAAASKYFTVRYVFFQQPILGNTTIDECITDMNYRNEIETNGELFSNIGFQSGDILVCQKDTEDETCSDSDFQWVDTNAGTLSSDRSSILTANLAQLDGDEAQAEEVDCEDNGGDMSLGGINIRANITSPFVITAVENADGTSKTYTYTPDCSPTSATEGGCTGDEGTTGTNVAFVIDFDTEQAIFVNSDDINDIDTVSVQDLLSNITSVMLKPLYILNNTPVAAAGLDPAWNASVTASLSASTFGTCTTDDECHTWAATISSESAAALGATNTINIQNAVCASFANGNFCTRVCAGNDIMHGICPTVQKGYGWGGITGTMECTTDTGGDTTAECPAGETCHCTYPTWY